MDLLDQPECSVHEITNLLRREPTLAAEVLRVSNSARYLRHKEPILELDTALVVIGLAEARHVALNAAIRGMIGPALGMPELRHCWSHCIAVAIVAEELSVDYGQRNGSAYIAGLLHDLGMLALLALHPDEYIEMLSNIEQDERDWRESEREAFGWDHEQLGALVIETLELPADLAPIASQHHDCADLSQRSMLALVAAADLIAASLGFQVGESARYATVEEMLMTVTLANSARTAEEIVRLRGRIEHATN